MKAKELIQILNALPEDTIIAHEKFMQRGYESIELKAVKYDFNQKRLTLCDYLSLFDY